MSHAAGPVPDFSLDRVIGQAMDGLCVGLVLTNPAGRILWMNRAAGNVLGCRDRDCRGEPITQVLQDVQMVKLWHEASASDATMHTHVSLRHPAPRELKVSWTQWADEASGMRGRGLLFCDVTEDRVVQLELSETVANKLLDMVSRGAHAAPSDAAGLTAQEVRVLGLVGQGMGNQGIADTCEVAPSTVRSHLKSIYKKLGLGSRAEAVKFAVQSGLI